MSARSKRTVHSCGNPTFIWRKLLSLNCLNQLTNMLILFMCSMQTGNQTFSSCGSVTKKGADRCQFLAQTIRITNPNSRQQISFVKYILVITTCYKHMGDQYTVRFEKVKRAFHNVCKNACTCAYVINITAKSVQMSKFLCTVNVLFNVIFRVRLRKFLSLLSQVLASKCGMR